MEVIMKDIFAEERTKAILMSVVMIVFGSLFIALPEASYNVIITVLAWILIAIGIYFVVSYFLVPSLLLNSIEFINGVLFILLGVLLLRKPEIYIALIGFVGITIGLQYVGTSLNKQRAHAEGWWQDLIYGAVEFVLGFVLVILNYTEVAKNAIMIYLGTSLIFYGLFVIVSIFTFRKKVKAVKKAVNEAVNQSADVQEAQVIDTKDNK